MEQQKFEQLCQKLKNKTFHHKHVQYAKEIISPPTRNDLTPIDISQESIQAGEKAIQNGEVGLCILNGGMATRFGGVVKGVVEVTPGLSFIGWKIKLIQEFEKKFNATIPLFIMCSFQTIEKTKEHLEEFNYFDKDKNTIFIFEQHKIPRLLPDSLEIAKYKNGESAYTAPGHGDFIASFKEEMLKKFTKIGGKYIHISNVDNLGANIDPAVIGTHVQNKADMTTEVAAKNPGDKGGAPAKINGEMQVVEQFQFPDSFDQDTIKVFNTNSFIINTDYLENDFNLPVFEVHKKDKEIGEVIQFESLLGHATIRETLTSLTEVEKKKIKYCFLEVPRDDRFWPVKTRNDLPHIQDLIKKKYNI
ncbi:UTP--glucose-1-phosphate uridylyltransferase [Candidatus Margulisiibacteriota bacterium]